MKNLVLLLFTLAANTAIYGQYNAGVYGTLGIRDISLDQTNITLEFVDSSPSRDNVTTNVTLREFSAPNVIGIGYMGDFKQSNFTFKLQAEAYFETDFFGYAFDVGPGYKFNFGILSVIPELLLGFGGSFADVGELENNSLYIQINETQFYSRSLEMRLEDGYFSLKPNVMAELKLFGPFALVAQAGLNLPIVKSDPQIKFTSPVEGSENVLITDDNLNLLIDNELSNDPIIKFGGGSVSIGLMYKINI